MDELLPHGSPGSTSASLDARLAAQPHLRARFHALLDVIDAASGECATAAQAETRVITEVRQLGHDALTAWSQRCQEHATSELQARLPRAQRHAKKKSSGTPPSAQ